MPAAGGYYSERRNRSLRTGTSKLFRTHRIASGAVATGTVFPYRTGDVTFEFELSIDGAAPSGTALVLGTTAQVKVDISGADLVVSAGSAGADGITLTAEDVLFNGKNHKVVIGIRAGSGAMRVWVDGRLAARGVSAGAGFPSGWADTGAGSYAGAMTQAATVGPLKAFIKQVPRHFSESLYS
jgi:hypothetical protein